MVVAETINENKALQRELQKEISRLIRQLSQENVALSEPTAKIKNNVSEGVNSEQCTDSNVLASQFAINDKTNKLKSDSAIMKQSLGKNETVVQHSEKVDSEDFHTLPVINSDKMPRDNKDTI